MSPITPVSTPQVHPPSESSTATASSRNTPTPQTPEVVQSAAAPEAESALVDQPNIDIITIDTPDTAVPDTIGYLHSLGIDYGWGPSSMLQWTIEHFHVWGGMPWWGAIAATSVVLRLVLLPLYMKSSDIGARSQALAQVTKPITDRMQEAKKNGDTPGMQQAWQQLMAVRRQAGISLPRQFLPMVVQGVFGYCAFKLLRATAALPVPAFKYEGFLWLQDLTVPDPYLILPVAMAGAIHALIRLGGESGTAAQTQMPPGMQKFMLYGMPLVILLGTGYLPAALTVWFAAGGFLGIGQSLLLRQPQVREMLGIAQIYKPPPGLEPTSELQALMSRRSKTIDVKAKVKEERSSSSTSAAGRPAAGVGKNEVFMRPTYQKPNLRFTSPARASSSSPQDVFENDTTPPPHTTTQAPAPDTPQEDEMIPPSGKTPSANNVPGGSGGVLDRASEAWKQTRAQATDRVKGYIEQRDAETGDVEERMEKRASEVHKRRADEYEKRKKSKKVDDGGQRKKGGKR